MKKIILLLIGVAISIAATMPINTTGPQYDYIRISDVMNGLFIEGDGLYGNTNRKLQSPNGYRVTYMVEAIEIMESDGYEVVTSYGNNAGHFTLMRKKL